MEMGYFIGVPNREQAKADVLQGTLDLLVLQTLAIGRRRFAAEKAEWGA
jgi:hypothetical protein